MELMIAHTDLNNAELHGLIRRKEMTWAGNRSLKIYGTLQCRSGKRMKRKNRVFFRSETEAMENGYRPCGHCHRNAYNSWKHGLIQHGNT